MSKRTMVPDYGVAVNARNRTVSIFLSVCFFSCEKSLCYFHYFNFTYSSNVTFQNSDVLKFVKRLYSAFKNFHVKNVCIMTSACILKNGAPTQVLRKVRILTKIWFMLYHERERKNKENANFVHNVYLLAKLCNIFVEAVFLLTSVYNRGCLYT